LISLTPIDAYDGHTPAFALLPYYAACFAAITPLLMLPLYYAIIYFLHIRQPP